MGGLGWGGGARAGAGRGGVHTALPSATPHAHHQRAHAHPKPALASCLSSPHASMRSASMAGQLSSMSSTPTPSTRHLTCTRFSYPVSTTGRTARMPAMTCALRAWTSGRANRSGHRSADAWSGNGGEGREGV